MSKPAWRVALALGTLALGASSTGATAAPVAPAFTEVSGSPFLMDDDECSPEFCNTDSVAFSPNGRLLAASNYVDGDGDGTIKMFSVGQDGTVTRAVVNGADSPVAIAFSPTGRLLASISDDVDPDDNDRSFVSMSAVGSNGELTPVSGYVRAGRAATSLAFGPNGRLLAVTSRFGRVAMFAVSARGRLVHLDGAAFTAGGFPAAVAFSSDGELLAVAGDSGAFQLYSVGVNGRLIPVVLDPSNRPTALAVAFSETGHFLATTTGRTVQMFSVEPDNSLTRVGEYRAASGRTIAFSQNAGQMLAVTSPGGNTVSVFSVGADGELLPVSGSPFATGANPVSVALSPNGQLVATANRDDSTVTVLDRSPGTMLIQTPASKRPRSAHRR